MVEHKDRSGLALAGSVFSALAASLCCIVPFVAAILGVAGFAVSEFFERWRPYLLAMTFGLLGLGFYLAYRPRGGEACASGAACGRSALGSWSQTMVWVGTVLVLVLSTFPYYGGRLVQALNRDPRPSGSLAASPTTHWVVNIEGMDCPVCAAASRRVSRKLPAFVAPR